MKILYITTISLTINAFFKPHIQALVKNGHTVDIACNLKDLELDSLYDELKCKSYQVDFSRSPLSPDNLKAYSQLKKVIENGEYDIVHCHTPNASMITRLVCRKLRKKTSLKVFYTAHGFHFFKGAPKLNWMIFYPIEKFCSRFTDKLITINQEDFQLAKSKFKAKEICYVPGVGVDFSRFENVSVDKAEKRKELGVSEDAFLLVSVGELSKRKNHEVILKAMAQLDDDRIHYILVGDGPLTQYLKDCARELNISQRVHFLGYRKDVAQLYKTGDVCCFPSLHEGLPVALMEAMACGIPVLCSRIRGNVDLIKEDAGFLLEPHDIEGFAQALRKMIDNEELLNEFSAKNASRLATFSKENALKETLCLYDIY